MNKEREREGEWWWTQSNKEGVFVSNLFLLERMRFEDILKIWIDKTNKNKKEQINFLKNHPHPQSILQQQ